MFTYHENRVLHLERGSLTFPCTVNATVELTPAAAVSDRVPGATCAHGSRARLSWDANTGRSTVECDPPLAPTDAAASIAGVAVEIHGRRVEARWECASRDELVGTLGALHFVLPLSLSLEFLDPLTPAVTSGRAGDAVFVWQVERTGGVHETLDGASRDARCHGALERLPTLCDPKNSRLLAASAYMHRAVRLLGAGLGPTEFAGEAVMNLAKTLEVLFPGGPTSSRDAVRAGLAQIGYERPAIENTFVPALRLRSSLDSAHVRMATLRADERRKLQAYMERVANEFRTLVATIADAVANGSFALAPYDGERSPRDDIAALLDRLDT